MRDQGNGWRLAQERVTRQIVEFVRARYGPKVRRRPPLRQDGEARVAVIDVALSVLAELPTIDLVAPRVVARCATGEGGDEGRRDRGAKQE